MRGAAGQPAQDGEPLWLARLVPAAVVYSWAWVILVLEGLLKGRSLEDAILRPEPVYGAAKLLASVAAQGAIVLVLLLNVAFALLGVLVHVQVLRGRMQLRRHFAERE